MTEEKFEVIHIEAVQDFDHLLYVAGVMHTSYSIIIIHKCSQK